MNINFEFQENNTSTLVHCDICKCLMPMNHNHEYSFFEPSVNIQYYWTCSFCGGLHSMGENCLFDRTGCDEYCPHCGRSYLYGGLQ